MMTYEELLKKLGQPLRTPVEVDPRAEAEKVARAARADQLLEDEMLSEAFDTVESVYMNAWKQSTGLDIELRERCFVATSLLRDLKGYLISCVREGEVARKRLDKITRQ